MAEGKFYIGSAFLRFWFEHKLKYTKIYDFWQPIYILNMTKVPSEIDFEKIPRRFVNVGGKKYTLGLLSCDFSMIKVLNTPYFILSYSVKDPDWASNLESKRAMGRRSHIYICMEHPSDCAFKKGGLFLSPVCLSERKKVCQDFHRVPSGVNPWYLIVTGAAISGSNHST